MWDFNLHLARDPEQTLFIQIAKTLVDDICRGRLRPGDRLPGTRTLARQMGVNRVTVLAAYDELAAEGWVATHPARGTFVSVELPQGQVRSDQPKRELAIGWKSAAYLLPAGASLTKWLQPTRGVLMFRSSYPDTRLVRVEPLVRAYRRVLRRSSGRLLGYGEPEGHPRLRRAISQMLRGTRALATSAENILITRGSQMALTLVSRALLRPGDVVAVEEPGYRHAWDAFKQAGATLVPIAVDDQGLGVAGLVRLAKRSRIRAVYVTPHHQLPTTVTLSANRRQELVSLARAHQFVIIEDDYDHEFHFDGPPVTPLASLDPSIAMYIGTFSKVLAPGLRLGYIAAPADVVERLSAYRQAIDMQGDPALEAALAELIEDDEIPRHVRRVKRIYRRRRDLLTTLLERSLGNAVSFSVPAGGIGLWVRVTPAVDVEAWAAASYRRGAAFLTAREFALDRQPGPYLRLGYACLNEQELHTAVDRIALGLSDIRTPQACRPDA
jgi:GntR family transcriptional regulator/MocR family aminotransferase